MSGIKRIIESELKGKKQPTNSKMKVKAKKKK